MAILDLGKHELFLSFYILLSTSLITIIAGDGIGVNYGTLANNLPPPRQVAAFLRDRTYINHIKLFDANPDIISAFAGTGISVTISTSNADILSIAKLPAARSWVAQYVRPFYPSTQIRRILVGNEIVATSDKTLISHLVPAMKSISSALKLEGFVDIQVTTPHSLGILRSSEPPSSCRFRPGYDTAIFAPMLDFLNSSKSPFMVNPYPYFGFSEKTLNYALFKPNAGIYDTVTGFNYSNMFDAQMDAVYTAMKRLGYANVDIVVGETGWPSVGDANQPYVNLENAVSFNGNLIRHVRSGQGTPLMPGRKFETFIFALFNENLKPGSTAERNFGLFRPDLTPVYDIGIMKEKVVVPPSLPSHTAGKTWCVPIPGVSDDALQRNIDYVCSSGVNCFPIQAGGPCYDPNTIRSHAAYAMNAYYQTHGRNRFNCDFAQTGSITAVDPSYRTCSYSP